jgi:hypothetical protein
MAIPVDNLFSSQKKKGSREWNSEIFDLAFGALAGPFEKVCDRLALGFSVLVYLPGNCMTAAADFVKKHSILSGMDWDEYGEHPGDDVPLDQVWQKSTGIVKKLKSWLSGGGGAEKKEPGAIFYNLDLLTDERGGIYPHLAAQMALFSMIESTRKGVVLGLSDRDAGPLPEAISRAFSEQIWLEDIDFERFADIIPKELGKKLAEDGKLSDGMMWLIATRLRSVDPIRAIKIMQNAASKDKDEIMSEIWKSTRSVEFVDPEKCFPGDPGKITGFPPGVIELLKKHIIEPFKYWTDFTGTREECECELRKLPPGLILYGPPGTGKTFLARWIGKSLGLPVRTLSGKDIRTPGFGDAEKNVHRIFRDARKAAPCLVVLDDADDLFPDRRFIRGSVAGAERGIVNTLLQELEGFYGRLDGVLVIMTTNRFRALDSAARRRLKLHIRVPYPLNKEQVAEIVDSIARDYRFDITHTREKLIGFFMGPVKPVSLPPDTDRSKVEENLFSPSEIQQAMLLLDDKSRYQSGYCIPPDIAPIEEYYNRKFL